MKLSYPNLKLAFAISLALLSCTPVQAELVNPARLGQRPTSNPKGQLGESSIFAAPAPPPGTGEPGRRSEAGGRSCSEAGVSECEVKDSPTPSSKNQLTALVPVYSGSELVFGATSADRPTFWFFVPYKSPATGTFVLQDSEQKLVYQTDFTLSETPGVLSLSLPSTAPPLESGKLYRWFFNIESQPQQPPYYVDGWIKKDSLNPTLTSQLEKATLQQRIALYATNGFWHEALTAAAELHRTNPTAPEWTALLRAVGLDAIATEPIVGELKSKK
jgi:hypothetical protein